MKKVSKLLTPILGVATLVGAIAPIASCGSSNPSTPTSDHGKVTFDEKVAFDGSVESYDCAKQKESKFKIALKDKTKIVSDITLKIGSTTLSKADVTINENIVTVPADKMVEKDIVITGINTANWIDDVTSCTFKGNELIDGQAYTGEKALAHCFIVKGKKAGSDDEVELKIGSDFVVLDSNHVDVTSEILNGKYALSNAGKVTMIIAAPGRLNINKSVEFTVRDLTDTVIYGDDKTYQPSETGECTLGEKTIHKDENIILNIKAASKTNSSNKISHIEMDENSNRVEIDKKTIRIYSSTQNTVNYQYDEENGNGKGGSRIVIYKNEKKNEPYELLDGETLTIKFKTTGLAAGDHTAKIISKANLVFDYGETEFTGVTDSSTEARQLNNGTPVKWVIKHKQETTVNTLSAFKLKHQNTEKDFGVGAKEGTFEAVSNKNNKVYFKEIDLSTESDYNHIFALYKDEEKSQLYNLESDETITIKFNAVWPENKEWTGGNNFQFVACKYEAGSVSLADTVKDVEVLNQSVNQYTKSTFDLKLKTTPAVINDVQLLINETTYSKSEGINIVKKERTEDTYTITVPLDLMTAKDIRVEYVTITKTITAFTDIKFKNTYGTESQGYCGETIQSNCFEVKGTVGGNETNLAFDDDYKIFVGEDDITNKISEQWYSLPAKQGILTLTIKATCDPSISNDIKIFVVKERSVVTYKYDYTCSSETETTTYSDIQTLYDDTQIVLSIQLKNSQTKNTIGSVELQKVAETPTTAQIDSSSIYIESTKNGIIPETNYEYDSTTGKIYLYNSASGSDAYTLQEGENLYIAFTTSGVEKTTQGNSYKFAFGLNKKDSVNKDFGETDYTGSTQVTSDKAFIRDDSEVKWNVKYTGESTNPKTIDYIKLQHVGTTGEETPSYFGIGAKNQSLKVTSSVENKNVYVSEIREEDTQFRLYKDEQKTQTYEFDSDETLTIEFNANVSAHTPTTGWTGGYEFQFVAVEKGTISKDSTITANVTISEDDIHASRQSKFKLTTEAGKTIKSFTIKINDTTTITYNAQGETTQGLTFTDNVVTIAKELMTSNHITLTSVTVE